MNKKMFWCSFGHQLNPDEIDDCGQIYCKICDCCMTPRDREWFKNGREFIKQVAEAFKEKLSIEDEELNKDIIEDRFQPPYVDVNNVMNVMFTVNFSRNISYLFKQATQYIEDVENRNSQGYEITQKGESFVFWHLNKVELSSSEFGIHLELIFEIHNHEPRTKVKGDLK